MRSLGYQDSGQGEPYFTNEKNVTMYHLLFFSQHPVGLTLWRNLTRGEPSGQLKKSGAPAKGTLALWQGRD